MKILSKIIKITAALLAFASCRKELLSEIPSSAYTLPDKESDFRALLDNENTFGRGPVLGEASSDDYYFIESYYSARSQMERNVYIWGKDMYAGTTNIYDWNTPYQQIQTCNIVLEGLPLLKVRSAEYNSILADALFKKSFAYYNLLQLFSPPYDSLIMDKYLGIPLKNSSDVNQRTVRSTVQESYRMVIAGLDSAASLPLVSDTATTYRSRTSRAAIFALLSRVYLSMGNYPMAARSADSCLSLSNTLIDYNSVSIQGNSPFVVRNPENIYTARVPSNIYQSILPMSGEANIDSALFASYDATDLRKKIFFYTTSGLPRRKNFYDNSANTLYTGLATDEVYLTLAECLARQGNVPRSLELLNKLLKTRMSKGLFTPIVISEQQALLETILNERRKELVMRGLRWTDLRRLNLEGRGIVPKRFLEGKTVSLDPNSKAYTLPIPDEVIQLTGIEQNPR